MGAILYHLLGEKGPATRERIAGWGLAYAHDGTPYNAERLGPGGAGILLADESGLAPFQPVYYPEEQTWVEIPRKYLPEGGPRVWIGQYHNEAARATAADLIRDELLDGEPVKLADDAKWYVPIVRCVDMVGQEYSPLPSYVTLDAEGKPKRGDIRPAYRRLWEAAGPFWDAWYRGYMEASAEAQTFRIQLDDETLYDSAAEMLGGNYRVGPAECALLGLFGTDGHMSDVMRAACQTNVALALLQKKSSPARSPGSKPRRGRRAAA